MILRGGSPRNIQIKMNIYEQRTDGNFSGWFPEELLQVVLVDCPAQLERQFFPLPIDFAPSWCLKQNIFHEEYLFFWEGSTVWVIKLLRGK